MSETDVHVYPVNDLYPHVTDGGECACGPKIETRGDGLVVIHRAFDLRDVIEAERIPATDRSD